MKKTKLIILVTTVLLVFNSCEENKNIDQQEVMDNETLIDIAPVYNPETLNQIEQNHSNLLFAQQNFQLINLPLVIHLVYDNSGSGQSLSSSQIQSIVPRLNNLYSSTSEINFEVCDIKVLNNSLIYDFDVNNNNNFEYLRSNHNNSDVINIYFVNSIQGGGNIAGLFYDNEVGDRNSFVMIDISYFDNNTTLEHEIGHFFYLYHTHGNYNITNFNGDPEELVDGSNCSTAGDRVCDSPADPMLLNKVDSNCIYIANETDSNGDFYDPMTDNIMSYSNNFCTDRITFGQLLRVGQVARITNLRGYLINNSCGQTNCSDFKFVSGYNPGFTISGYPFSYDMSINLNTLQGGVEPFEYRIEGIDNPNISFPFQNSTIFEIPEAGLYALIVKDSNGCIANRSRPFFNP